MRNSLAEALGAALAPQEEQKKLDVWAKGQIIPTYDPTVWRRDAFNHTICFASYGDRDSQYGWEIDHIVPVGLAGGDDLSNLRPLHCANNAALGGLLSALKRRGI